MQTLEGFDALFRYILCMYVYMWSYYSNTMNILHVLVLFVGSGQYSFRMRVKLYPSSPTYLFDESTK